MPDWDYRRRYYHRPSELARDLRVLLGQRAGIRTLRKGRPIDRAFQERLMLAVTQVNGCRYCSYAHARLALAVGVTRADVDALGRGGVAESPPEQVPALLYAQHWAETGASPDAEARQTVLETYGRAKTEAIELSMRLIRVGNLAGNTWDYLMYRLSFGRWGNTKPLRSPHFEVP